MNPSTRLTASTGIESILFGVRGDPNDGGWCEAAHRAAAAVRERTGCRIEITETLPERPGAEWSAVVGHGTDFAGGIVRAARDTPDVTFLLTDYIGEDIRAPLPNLCCVDWHWDEGAYLAGVLASQLSCSGKIGVLGGAACRTQYLATAGFVRGASRNAAGLEILTALAGSFDDPERGFRLANALFDEGVDVLLHTADSTGRGAIRAASGRDRRMIGFLNHDDSERDCVAAVISTDVGGLVAALLDELAAGERPATVVPAGFASGRQRLDSLRGVPDPIRQQIDEISAMLVAGSLRVRDA